jgi:hypothetical protein
VRVPPFLLLPALAVFVAAAILIGRGSDSASPGYVTEHPVEVPTTARTVQVYTTMPQPSVDERLLSARLEVGELPSGPTMAEVLSDTECQPDRRMISRCRNEMRLADGRTIVVRHPHDMRNVPCLAPGEMVQLMPMTLRRAST